MQSTLVHDIPEAGHILHCGRSTIYQLIKGGHLSVIKVGRRTLIPHSSIVAFVEREQTKAS